MTSANCGQSDEIAGIGQNTGLFLAVKDKMIALARKRGVFMAAERTDKKRDTPERMSP